MNNLKVLCFTTSYNRHKMLRGTMFDIKNQSYKNIYHSVNIAVDSNNKSDYTLLYDDIENINIVYNKNEHQHYNYLHAITSVDYEDYDLFIKIDDDDVYKSNYVKTIVDFFSSNSDIDVISSKINYQLNGSVLRYVNANNLGGNPELCDFKMPMTFAFNKPALKLILECDKTYGFEDHMWRDVWCEKCNIAEIDNKDNIIWYIHGKNISTSNFLIDTNNILST